MNFWTIINTFKIHLFFYLFAFICLFTGNIKIFFAFLIITVIHELGHIVGGIFFDWKIEKILLLPFGMLTIFKTDINVRLIEEFIVTILGPLFQIIITLIINDEIINEISYTLLIFNLLPIYPLDGSKIINVILNKIFSFKKSYIYIIYISIIAIALLLIKTQFNLIIFISLLFLIKEIIYEYKIKNYIFNKFLLERLNKKYSFKKIKIINNINNMKRDYSHIFIQNKKPLTEKQFLKQKFDFKKYL